MSSAKAKTREFFERLHNHKNLLALVFYIEKQQFFVTIIKILAIMSLKSLSKEM